MQRCIRRALVPASVRTGIWIAAVFAVLSAPGARADVPRVVASIPPVGSLVAMAMEGVGTPQVLLKGGASPHSYSLRPSDTRALAEAGLIVRVGEGLETFLDRPLRSLGRHATVLDLENVPGLTKLPIRPPGAWNAEEEAEGQGRDDHDREALAGGVNPHVWLDTGNARVILSAVATTLARLDPAHAAAYAANAQRWSKKLAALHDEIARRVATVHGVPFVVLHDAWAYFDAEFGLEAVGSIAVSPERAPGARRLVALRQRIRDARVKCVFSEPQFPSAIVTTLVRGTDARIAALDPLGVTLRPGVALYGELMRNLSRDLVTCLSAK